MVRLLLLALLALCLVLPAAASAAPFDAFTQVVAAVEGEEPPPPVDTDGDTVPDETDNCDDVPNTDQADTPDKDGIGNACDPNDDNDPYADDVDKCDTTPSSSNADRDGDGLGDVCDSDRDGDEVLNGDDNCPNDANATQADVDDDGKGNACDNQSDGDTHLDSVDNCPTDTNQDQKDTDGDTFGDACDNDDDADGRNDVSDNCATAANGDQADLDGDKLGDACDADVDGDGLDAGAESTKGTDARKVDTDGDGVFDNLDPCPVAAGPGGCPAEKKVETVVNVVPGGGTTGGATTATNDGSGALIALVLAAIADAHKANVTAVRRQGIAGLLAGRVRTTVHTHYAGTWKLQVLSGRTVVAQGRKTFNEPDVGTVRVKPTAAGRLALPAATRLPVVVRTIFVPAGFRKIVRSKAVVILPKK